LWMSGQALAYLAGEYDGGLVAIERALALSPSSAVAHVYCGWVHNYRGEGVRALERFRDALRLSPYDDMALFLYTGMARAYFVEQNYEEAIAAGRRALQGNALWAATYRILAACYAHLGRLDEAHATIARLRAISPLVIPNLDQFRNPEHRELLLSGLRLAVGETT
jgi:adenylate cyclase